jgi:hypothetical protein
LTRVLLENLTVSAASQEIPRIPYSQVPATFPYPEPTPSSPHNPSHLLKIQNAVTAVKSRKMSWEIGLTLAEETTKGYKILVGKLER